MNPAKGQSYRFAGFLLDLDKGRMTDESGEVALRPKALDLLAYLVGNAGRVVPKAELMDAIWPDVTVTEDSLTQCVSDVRRALGDKGQELVRTVARRGYVFAEEALRRDDAAKASALADLPLPSLAVLPFVSLGGSADDDWFADGVVGDIITALSRFRSFAVIARNSSFIYKGRSVDVRQVADELGVRYVLEGSLRRAGGRLRMAAQLIDGRTGAHLWADRIDGAVEDVFDFQDRLTERVAMAIEPHIEAAEIRRSRMERPGSIAVYDIYLRAQTAGIYTGSLDDNAAAYALLTEALSLDPDNPVLLAFTAWALGHRIVMGAPPFGTDDRERCVALARRGLELADGDAVVTAYCGLVLHHVARDYQWGMEVSRLAFEANPNNLMVVTVAGIVHLHTGSVETALACFRRASQLSPRDPKAHLSLTGVAHVQMILGSYAEALATATRSLALNQNFAPTYWMLIAANAQMGRMDEARRHLAAYRKVSPDANIAAIEAGQPASDPARLAAIIDGLRLAGLPE